VAFRPAAERDRRPPSDGERGTGVIGTVIGFAVFLVLLLVAVQVLFDLYARSALTAAAFDAARRVAGYDLATLPTDQLTLAEADAESQARQSLGRYGRDVSFTWTLTPTDVELRVRIVNSSVVPNQLAAPMGIDVIDRTVRVHAERLICPTNAPCTAQP
jgi:hypothetical protein